MATESSSPFAIFFSSRGSPTSASSPSKPRTFFEFLGLGPKVTEEEIPSFRAGNNSTKLGNSNSVRLLL